MTRKAQRVGAGLLLLAAIAAAYSPAVLHGGFVWDDDDHVTENPTLGSLHGLRQIWLEPGAVPQYFPLVHTGFWIQHRLWGLDPTGYHLVNVLLHGLVSLLVWSALEQLGVRGAFFAAALFGLHPVHVESVAWVAELKNVLSGAFYLAALLVLLRAHPAFRTAADAEWRRGPLLVATLLYTCAMLSKTVSVTLPAVFLCLVWWKSGRIRRADALAMLPLLGIGLPLAGLGIWLQRTVVGAVGPAFALDLLDRLAIAGPALWFYVGKLVWPSPLILVYPKWPLEGGATWLLACAAALLPCVLWLARRRVGRAPFAAAACFGVTLAPVLGFFDHYTLLYYFVADHFVYLASVPLLALFVGALAERRIGCAPIVRRAAVGLAIVLLSLLAARTWHRAHDYADEETLWRDTLAKNPGAVVAHVNLAGLLIPRGATEEAERHLRQALALDPRMPDAYNNLGIVLFQRGEIAASIRSYEAALRLDADRGDVRNNLGISLAESGRIAEAAREFERAVVLMPSLARGWHNLGLVQRSLGQPGEAVRSLAEAVRLAAWDADSRLEYARALVVAGDPARAGFEFREALRLRPGWPAALQGLAEAERHASPAR